MKGIKMKYIWINPVTENMYNTDELNAFLARHGYERIHIKGDWLNIVREKYKENVRQADHTVIDVRCPKIKGLAEEYGNTTEMVIPDINPILIHCGQESSERKDLSGKEKIMTTPCQALADMGNALGLPETRFIPWNQFVASTGDSLKGIKPKASPIPPGFFDGTNLKTMSVTGEEDIRDYFKNYKPDEVQLVEMLFCEKGCHNGDGVRMCED